MQDDTTQPVLLSDTYSSDLAVSGSFDVTAIGKTAFGTLLNALPIPALLLDSSCTVAFSNQAWNRLAGDSRLGSAYNLGDLLVEEASAQEVKVLVDEVYRQRKPQVTEAALEVGESRIWGRLNLRSLRTGCGRSVLVLVEDLTLEKNRIELTKKYQEELEKRVEERTAELAHANAKLQAEVCERSRAEAELAAAGRELELRVEHRTAQLKLANESLLKQIIERTRTEKLLRESEERFRSYFELSLVGMATTDTEKRWIEVNDKLCEILGYDRTELTGTLWADLTHPEDLRSELRYYSEVVSGDINGYSMEKRFLRKNGEPVHALVSIRCLRKPDGSVDHFSVLVQDITGRRIDREKQEQLVEEIKNFAYIVSHDLRAPLINLKGFSRELQEHLAVIGPAVEAGLAGLPEADRSIVNAVLDKYLPESLGFISSAVSRMDSMVGAILKLSRLGHVELQLEPLRLGHMAREILNTNFAYQIIQGKIRVTVGKLPEVVGDRTSMEQILANLLGNAIKFLEPGRPGEIEISGERNPDEAVIRVKDNGRGINEADMGKVFEIFQRVGRQDVPGEGMGLAYVRALVRRHGGRIWCESTPGVGSTFTFSISSNLVPRLNILVIDDMEGVVRLLRTELGKYQHHVLTALSGEEGLELFMRHPVDVVICDLGMSGLNGWEIGKRIKAVCRQKGIPKTVFLLLTGWAGQREQKELIAESGVDAVVEKPVETGKLLELIGDLIRARPQEKNPPFPTLLKGG